MVGRGNGQLLWLCSQLQLELLTQQLPVFQQVDDARFQQGLAEGFGNIIIGPCFQAFLFIHQRGSGRQQDHRNVAGPHIAFQPLYQADAIPLSIKKLSHSQVFRW